MYLYFDTMLICKASKVFRLSGRMELLFTEIGKTVEGADWR